MKSLVIVGASGVGKGTIIKRLMSKYDRIFSFVLSYTTRSPRSSEKHGIDYLFVSDSQFQLNKRNMLEHTETFQNKYGTSKLHLESLLKEGKIPILDIDIEGVRSIHSKIQCEILCVMPPSWKVLRQRLCGRKSQSLQAIEKRMKENRDQVEKMLKLKGIKNLNYITNYEYPITVFGIENWMKDRFQAFPKKQAPSTF